MDVTLESPNDTAWPCGRRSQAFGAGTAAGPSVSFGDFATVSFSHRRTLARWVTPGCCSQHAAWRKRPGCCAPRHEPEVFPRYDRGQLSSGCSQAALLDGKLPHLAEYTAMRQQHMASKSSPGAGPGQGRGDRCASQTHQDRTHITTSNPFECSPEGVGNRADRRAMRYASTFRSEESLRKSTTLFPSPTGVFSRLRPSSRRRWPETLAAEVISLPVFPRATPKNRGPS